METTPPRRHARLGWNLTVFDSTDKVVTTKKCKSLDEVARVLGLNKGAELSFYIYRGRADKAKVRAAMLNRFRVWFTVEAVKPQIPDALRALIEVAN